VTARSAAVIVCSTRAAAGVYTDRTGPVIVDWLRARGFETDDATVVPDGPLVTAALERAVGTGHAVVISTGGTGIGPGDMAADVAARLITVPLPGFHEELRRRGALTTPFALMSRGVAGIAGESLLVTLPGSTGGVRDGLTLLDQVLEHVLDQRAGGAHDEPTEHDAASAGPGTS
jgi:molybdenum cofactor synthesis domain-containing protein